jgi:hypothetical protein
VAGTILGGPGWLGRLDASVARWTTHHGTFVVVALVVVEALIGLGLLVPRTARLALAASLPQLDRRKGHVPGDRVRRDDARAPPDRGGDEMALSGRGRGDDLPREAGSKHEGLELQPAVQQPQRDLQVAAGDANAVGKGNCVHVGCPYGCQCRVA